MSNRTVRIVTVVMLAALSAAAAERQAKVLRLINAYRVRGHQNANLDPLHLRPQLPLPDLQPSYYGLDKDDMDTVFNTGSLYAPDRMTLREIIALVEQVYCGPIGFEYMHITDTAQKRWIQKDPSMADAAILDADGKQKTIANPWDPNGRLDRCPGTVTGAEGDGTGCEPDADGDGVLDDAEFAAAMYDGMLPMDAMLRQSGHFGPRVEVSDDADPVTKLIAFTGRTP